MTSELVGSSAMTRIRGAMPPASVAAGGNDCVRRFAIDRADWWFRKTTCRSLASDSIGWSNVRIRSFIDSSAFPQPTSRIALGVLIGYARTRPCLVRNISV